MAHQHKDEACYQHLDHQDQGEAEEGQTERGRNVTLLCESTVYELTQT